MENLVSLIDSGVFTGVLDMLTSLSIGYVAVLAALGALYVIRINFR